MIEDRQLARHVTAIDEDGNTSTTYQNANVQIRWLGGEPKHPANGDEGSSEAGVRFRVGPWMLVQGRHTCPEREMPCDCKSFHCTCCADDDPQGFAGFDGEDD